jgi:hypothetical protein
MRRLTRELEYPGPIGSDGRQSSTRLSAGELGLLCTLGPGSARRRVSGVTVRRRELTECPRLMEGVDSSATESMVFVDSSSVGAGRGDVRAVVVDRGAGDMVVPRDEDPSEVGSSTTTMRSTLVDSESSMAPEPIAGGRLDIAGAYDSSGDC